MRESKEQTIKLNTPKADVMEFANKVVDDLINHFAPDQQIGICLVIKAQLQKYHRDNADSAYKKAEELKNVASKFD